VQSLSQEAKFFAHLSSVAYYEPRQRPLRQKEFDLDLEFNTDLFAVYVRGRWLSAKAVVITFRGTSDMSDQRNELLLASNANVNRLQQLLGSEVECIGAVAAKYPEARIHVTGHSLGGTIAMFVTVHTGLVSGGHIFNPGAGVKTEELLVSAAAFGTVAAAGALICADQFAYKSNGVGKAVDLANRINTHHVLGDPLSLLFSLGNIQCYPPTRANLHALTNFIDENLPSTDCVFDSHAHCKDLFDTGKGAPTARARGRTTSLKTEARSCYPHGSSARRVHSHSSTGGWTEVVGHKNRVTGKLSSHPPQCQVVGKTAHSLMKRSVTPLIEMKDGASPVLDVDEGWTELNVPYLKDDQTSVGAERSLLDSLFVASGDVNEDWVRALSTVGVAEDSVFTASGHTMEDWRSALGVGSMVEVFAYAAEGPGQGRKWVGAEVVIARPEVLTLKWVAADGGGEILRRVARCSAQIRSAGDSAGDHADSDPAAVDNSISAPEVNVQEDLVDVLLPDDSEWRAALTVGSIAELRVKRQWILAEVSIERENSLTMKWIDCQDGAEAMRRIARSTSDLRPCRVKMPPR